MTYPHMFWLIGLALLASVSAAEVEVITLSDGRVLTGVYDDEANTVTLSGGVSATIHVNAAQIVSRQPAGGAVKPKADLGGAAPALAMPGSQVDPAVLAPLIAPGVPWQSGDRILIIGDLLVPPGQPELALRIHDALVAGVPDKELVVFSLQNHGLSLERVAAAAREEMTRRPPKLVLILAGVGDVVALLPPPIKPAAKPVAKPATPVPPTPPVKLPLPTAEAWQATLSGLVTAAQNAGAAVVVATPAIVGDKPFDGPGSLELDAYATAARAVAADTKAGLCELRTPLLAKLTERNPKGTRELGILSKAFGQLKPEAMDLCAGLIAQAMADAVPRIPWTVDMPDVVFAGTITVGLHAQRLAPEQVTWRVTTDGSEPSPTQAPLTKPLVLDATALVRVLAEAKDGSHRNAQAWYMATTKQAAEVTPPETLPGLWVDHVAKAEWGEGLPRFPGVQPEVETWWPNVELEMLERLPVGRKPASLACLRYSGYFIAPLDGTYVFSLRSAGEARLFLGDLPIARIKREGRSRWCQGAVQLAKGYHTFMLCAGQGSSTATLELQVAEPGKRLQPLPDLLLRRPSTKLGGGAAVIDTVTDPGDPAAPWTVRLTGRAFSDSTKAEIEVLRIGPERLNIYYTTDGSAPSDKSLQYTKPITISSTTQVRVLAMTKAGDGKVTTDAWFSETRKHAADSVTGETLPGLWTEHCTLKQWLNPVASIDTMKPDFISWWPNGELAAFSSVAVHRWPNDLFGMRWSGWFLAPVDGTYVFATNSDDATRVSMGPVSVLRNDDMHPDRWQYGAVELTKGFHQLGMLYGQGPAIYTMEVYVGLSGQRLQLLPDLLLRRSPQPPTRKGLAVESTDETGEAGTVSGPADPPR